MAETATLRDLAEPLLAEVGLRLWDIEVSRDVVRVLVERDGGVDLDALSTASRALSSLLDDHEDATPPGTYQLEISSPGLERRLRTPAHFRHCVGERLSVKTVSPVDGSRRHVGTLLDADDTSCELVPEEGPAGRLVLTYDQIERAHVVFDWRPAPKPGAPGPSRRQTTGPQGTVHDTKDRQR
jgi:ribosome maturation factor RimP